MVLDESIEVDYGKERVNTRLTEIMAILDDTGRGAKLRLITELAEELSKYYNVHLHIKEMKQNELLTKKIVLDLVKTPDIRNWLSF